MTTPKNGAAGQTAKDALLEAGPNASAVISDADLDNVTGGAPKEKGGTLMSSQNDGVKTKRPDKTFDTMNAYIRG
jgi:hypothetical protein